MHMLRASDWSGGACASASAFSILCSRGSDLFVWEESEGSTGGVYTYLALYGIAAWQRILKILPASIEISSSFYPSRILVLVLPIFSDQGDHDVKTKFSFSPLFPWPCFTYLVFEDSDLAYIDSRQRVPEYDTLRECLRVRCLRVNCYIAMG